MAAGRGKQRWKRAEMELARMMGTERIPNNGFGQPDYLLPARDGQPPLAVQVKTRATMPQWFLDAMQQAVIDAENTDDDALPAVAYVHAPGSGRKKQRYLVLRFEDAVKLITPDVSELQATPDAGAGREGNE